MRVRGGIVSNMEFVGGWGGVFPRNLSHGRDLKRAAHCFFLFFANHSNLKKPLCGRSFPLPFFFLHPAAIYDVSQRPPASYRSRQQPPRRTSRERFTPAASLVFPATCKQSFFLRCWVPPELRRRTVAEQRSYCWVSHRRR